MAQQVNAEDVEEGDRENAARLRLTMTSVGSTGQSCGECVASDWRFGIRPQPDRERARFKARVTTRSAGIFLSVRTVDHHHHLRPFFAYP
jgi:hypothetical protein